MYRLQLDRIEPAPFPRWELNSLITAATKPQAIPVTAPSTAARRRAEAGDRRGSPNAIAKPASPAGGGRGEGERAGPGRRGGGGEPVASRPPPAAEDGHVGEHEQQLEREHGL